MSNRYWFHLGAMLGLVGGIGGGLWMTKEHSFMGADLLAWAIVTYVIVQFGILGVKKSNKKPFYLFSWCEEKSK